MDRYSEVEAKFDAQDLTVEKFHSFITGQLRNSRREYVILAGYKQVSGTDTYYDLNGKTLRFRQGDMPGGELTYKSRKAADSIQDRVEINLRLAETAAPADTHTLLAALGGKEQFQIKKTSFIYRLDCSLNPGIQDGTYEAVIALYDVFDSDINRRRFLEVEIEASSVCDDLIGRQALDLWVTRIQSALKRQVTGPLNQSLFEIYSKGPTTT